MNANIVFPDMNLDDAPMEVVSYPSDGSTHFELDERNGDRVAVVFDGVLGLRLEPSALHRVGELVLAGGWRKTILEVEESPWVQAVNMAMENEGDRPSVGLRHYVIPSYDSVWEVLAHDCHRERIVESRPGRAQQFPDEM